MKEDIRIALFLSPNYTYIERYRKETKYIILKYQKIVHLLNINTRTHWHCGMWEVGVDKIEDYVAYHAERERKCAPGQAPSRGNENVASFIHSWMASAEDSRLLLSIVRSLFVDNFFSLTFQTVFFRLRDDSLLAYHFIVFAIFLDSFPNIHILSGCRGASFGSQKCCGGWRWSVWDQIVSFGYHRCSLAFSRGLICFLRHHSWIPISPFPIPPHLLFSILQAHFFITKYIIIFLVFSLHFYYMIFFGNKIIKFMFIFFFSPFPFFAIFLLNEKGKVKKYTPNERKIRVEKV